MTGTMPRESALRARWRVVVPLDADVGVALVGEKAHTLGRMMRAGVRVPDGVVLTTRTFQQFRSLPAGTALPDHMHDEIVAAARPLLDRGRVVVRSSAIGEDAPGQSFAGQLDSILHVSDEDALVKAVVQCWSSYWSDRALFYRRARGAADSGMGVVIQQQVDALAAGVLFTNAGDGSLLAEYTAGLGDALVSGAIDPGRLSIDRASGERRNLAPALSDDGGTFELGGRVVEALHATGLALERELGGPQDIEWVLARDGALWIVQSRPITASVCGRPEPCSHPEQREGSGLVAHKSPQRAQIPRSPSLRSGSVGMTGGRPGSGSVGMTGDGASGSVGMTGGRRISWSNANVNENFPAPISPLLYSIATQGYTHYFRNLAIAFGVSRRRIRAMEPAFRQIIGTHGARMYYNLTSIHSILRLAPFGGALTASFDSFVGADGDAVGVEPLERVGKLRQLAEVAVIAARSAWQYRALGRRIARFEATVDAYATRTQPARLASMSLADLRAALAGFVDIRCNRWLDASLADYAAMICYGALERLLARAYPDGTRGAVHTSLLKAIPGVVSGEPVHQLWNLSRLIRDDSALAALFEQSEPPATLAVIASDDRFATFRVALQRYLDDWGFRCSEELMLTSPSFQENPAPLVEMLRAYARVDAGSPDETLRQQSLERDAETARVLAETGGRAVFGKFPLPTYAQALRVLLPWTQAAIRYRERARLKQALLYSRCRRVALALGDALSARGLLDARDDVFFLTASELDELAGGAAMLPGATQALVAARKAEHARLSATTPPDAFTLPQGDYWSPKAEQQSSRGSNATEESGFVAQRAQIPRVARDDSAVTRDDRILRGTGACGGRVTGRATVLRDVTQAGQLAPGDVLVTKQTDPGWGPVFFLISGLVIERGGMLSHGAIIAREFGIPCVVGVRDAMRTIASGSTLTVDGDAGAVHVLA